ncbi:MAG TPA: hypothetical protein VLA37_01730, partial [Sphingomonadaceae bacterium]|nr:hypothetical protein [Sphingomonadaceae bacterium]
RPQSGLEGKFSVFHAAAVGIIHRAAGEAQFSDEVVLDPRVIALRDRICATENRSIGRTEAKVSIRLKDGTQLDRHVPHALGSLERPMSDADLETKFRGLVAEILSEGRTRELIDACWSLESLDDAGEIARLATPV